MSKSEALKMQIGGDHYKDFEIQPVVFCEANNLGFILSCIVKYACRVASASNTEGYETEDLDKIKHYCDLYKEIHHDEI